MLAIETLLGALTGYFTNDIAIRQLFSQNGMVVREREQFTALIVEVLKDKIIDAETVEALRDRPEMVTFFEAFIEELFGETLPTAFAGKSLAEYDLNGALQGFVREHIAAVPLEDAQLDSALLYEHIDAYVQSDAFKQALADALHNLSQCSLKDVGLADIFVQAFAPLRAMDEESWQSWIDEKQAQVKVLLSEEKNNYQSNQTMKALLATDGEALVARIEAYFGVDLTQPEQLAQFSEWYQAFLEQLYVFAARVLPQILEMHLPALVEAVYPMLASDREWIEQMVLQSIHECNTDDNMILSVASGYVENFFTPDEDGRDWLEKFFDQLKSPEESAVIYTKFADFLCGLVMQQIDAWRRLDLSCEENIQTVKAAYRRIRGLVVKGFDVYLTMPAHGNKVHHALMNGVVGMAFAWLRACVSAEAMHVWIEQAEKSLLSQPLESLFLDKTMQRTLVNDLCAWWHENGNSWLGKQDFGENTLKQGLSKAVDRIFDMPIGDLLKRTHEILPNEPLADLLRMTFFGHLREFLARMTKGQLDSLTHEEIREVVLDMVGREMKPLAYLGGGIGAIAGVATGAAMQSCGMTMDAEQMPLMMAARSGMYGAVGYGTNVMAVKGLFWPYKKTLGMQGLICKNQGRFALKMKNMAESYIINDEIWMQQVVRVSDRIASHNDEVVRYGLHLMDKKRDKVVRPVVEMVSRQLPHQACRMLFEEKQAAKLLERVAENGIKGCLNAQTLSMVLTKSHAFHHGVCKIAMLEAKDRTVSEKIVQKLQGVSEDKWAQLGNALLGKWYLPQDEGAYDALWQRILPYYRILPTLLRTYIHDIAVGLDHYVSRKLSFPLQLAYRMAGGDRQIERVVAHIIESKLPQYVAEKEAQIGDILVSWAKSQFAGRSVMECGLNVSEAQGQYLYEWIEHLQPERIHAHAMALLMQMEKWPSAYVEVINDEIASFSEPLIKKLGQTFVRMDGCKQVDWALVTKNAEPILQDLRENGLRDVSLGALFTLSDEQIWNWSNALFHGTKDETDSLVQLVQGVWQEGAPAFWQSIGQSGRVLLMMVDIPNLTHERICALSPQELEVMVRDIAQPYFTRVERMGWLGAVVALPATMISMMLGGM